MNFKFYPDESKVYDFLRFPKLLYHMESYEECKKDCNYKNINMDEYLDFVKKVEERLKPFSKEIEEFYAKPFSSEHSFIDLNIKSDTILGYRDENKFLDYLLTLTEEDINKNIIYSLIINEENQVDSNEIMKRAEEICLNKKDILSFIKELSIDPGLKWNLFLIVEDPALYMQKYVDLMIKIYPIFEEFYKPLTKKVKDYGQYLENYLNKNGAESLEDLTYSLFNLSMIKGEIVHLLVSITFAYSISLMPKEGESVIVFGLKIEEALKQIEEINENKTYERVQIFKNLGDKTRYEVLKRIALGETSIKEIANVLGVSSATISYHINNLLTSKAIKLDRTDNKFGYIVNYGLLEKTIDDFKKDLKFPRNN